MSRLGWCLAVSGLTACLGLPGKEGLPSGADAGALDAGDDGGDGDAGAGTRAPFDGGPRGRWSELVPEPSLRYRAFFMDPARTDAQQPDARVETRQPFFREYSSPIVGGGVVYLFGGAHSGYAGNDVEVLELRAPRWAQSYRPNVPAPNDPVYGSGGSAFSWIDPLDVTNVRPLTIHGYARQTYFPLTDEYVVTAGFCLEPFLDGGVPQCARRAHSLLAFDRRANRWRRVGPAMDNVYTLTEWDERWRGVFSFRNEGPNTRVMLSHDDGGLEQRGSFANVTLDGEGGAATIFVPPLGAHWVAVLPHGGPSPSPRVWAFTADAGLVAPNQLVELTASFPLRLRTAMLDSNFAMSWDARNRQVLALTVEADGGSPALGARGRPHVFSWAESSGWTDWGIDASSPLVVAIGPSRGRRPFGCDPDVGCLLLIGNPVETWRFQP